MPKVFANLTTPTGWRGKLIPATAVSPITVARRLQRGSGSRAGCSGRSQFRCGIRQPISWAGPFRRWQPDFTSRSPPTPAWTSRRADGHFTGMREGWRRNAPRSGCRTRTAAAPAQVSKIITARPPGGKKSFQPPMDLSRKPSRMRGAKHASKTPSHAAAADTRIVAVIII